MNEKTVVVRMLPDGSLERKTATGSEKIVVEPLPPFETEFEPVYDPENPPLTDEQLKRMKRISLAKHLRFKLGLSQAAFAERYHIPIGTLRDWEQYRSEPDVPARALLHLIAIDPEWAAEKLREKRVLSAVAP